MSSFIITTGKRHRNKCSNFPLAPFLLVLGESLWRSIHSLPRLNRSVILCICTLKELALFFVLIPHPGSRLTREIRHQAFWNSEIPSVHHFVLQITTFSWWIRGIIISLVKEVEFGKQKWLINLPAVNQRCVGLFLRNSLTASSGLTCSLLNCYHSVLRTL